MNPDVLGHNSYKNIIIVGENGVIDEDTSPYNSLAYTGKLQRDRRIKNILIPEECLNKRITAMVDEIARDYPPERLLHMLVVLTGAIFFAADLGRQLYDRAGMNVQYHLVKTSTYAETMKKPEERSRSVHLELEPKGINGKNILIVEDIVDQGFTLTWLKEYLLSKKKVSSVRICCLLDKVLKSPSVEVQKVREQLLLDYTGFTTPDIWVAGYGIDIAHELRNLSCIVSINESLYI